ncbi:MAG: SDR family NAD(P)-dependent oxidoreductase [Saprospiraceae bacterium]|uniref:SDR family NAD(P)-dependent oxidoreductase n=1 Tax=Candidatus Opimibacter skivensis TaxID=2982028 RepID=A0A9D7SQK9_9BACT|nr:SDR family NAD(P)-dependent oxidoreductase [Candidatus Opimibacter skivensis]
MKYFVLVTGASSGIGEAACKTLAENNYDVLAGVRNTADGARLESNYGSRIHSLMMDVVDEESIKHAKEKAKEIIGIDALVAIVNNAGIVVAGAFLYVPIEKWKYQLDVNVLGVIRTTQIFFDLLKVKLDEPYRHPRRIINISSVSGLFASPFIGAYAASKFALEALSDSLRRELYMYDIQVVLIEPGNIITPIWEKAKKSDYYSGPEYDSITAYKEKLIDENIRQGLKADIVADRILKSIRNEKVSARYLIRAKAWKFRLIQLLPVRWVDLIIRNKLKSNSGIRPF